MSQTNLTVRIDEGIKQQAEVLFNKIGLNMSSAINVFFRQAIRVQAIPFELKAYDDYQAKIEQSILELYEGKRVSFSLEELESLEDMDTNKAMAFIEARRRETGEA